MLLLLAFTITTNGQTNYPTAWRTGTAQGKVISNDETKADWWSAGTFGDFEFDADSSFLRNYDYHLQADNYSNLEEAVAQANTLSSNGESVLVKLSSKTYLTYSSLNLGCPAPK